jgi:hypothetical protein
MVDQASDDAVFGCGRIAHGVVPTSTSGEADCAFGSRQPILWASGSVDLEGIWHEKFDESQR